MRGVKILGLFSAFALILNNKIEVEWHKIVTDLKTMIKIVFLVPLVEQMSIFHQQIIVSNLRKTDTVVFSDNSGSKVGLLN